MSITGTVMYAALNQKANDLRDERDKAAARYRTGNEELQGLQKELGQAYSTLAEIFVPSRGRPLIKKYDAKHARARRKQAQALAKNQSALEENLEAQTSVSQRITLEQELLHELYDERIAKEEEVESAVQADDTYIRVEKERAVVQGKIQDAQEVYETVLRERDTKLSDYGRNPFFAHLAQRGYQYLGSQNDTGYTTITWFDKFADKILAQQPFVNWERNAKNLGMLVDAPIVVQRNIVALQRKDRSQEIQLAQITEQYEIEKGYESLVERISLVQRRKENLDRRLAKLEREANVIETNIIDAQNHEGTYYQDLVAQVVGDLKKKKSTNTQKVLGALARKTTTELDDQAVNTIVELERKIAEKEEELQTIEANRQAYDEQYKQALQSRDEIRRSHKYNVPNKETVTRWVNDSSGVDWDDVRSQIRNTHVKPQTKRQPSYSSRRRTSSRKTTSRRSFGGGGAGGSWGGRRSSGSRSMGGRIGR